MHFTQYTHIDLIFDTKYAISVLYYFRKFSLETRNANVDARKRNTHKFFGIGKFSHNFTSEISTCAMKRLFFDSYSILGRHRKFALSTMGNKTKIIYMRTTLNI